MKQLEQFKEDYLKDLVVKNISYYVIKEAQTKNTECIPLGIQRDLSDADGDYK